MYQFRFSLSICSLVSQIPFFLIFFCCPRCEQNLCAPRYEDSEIELTVVDEDVMLAWAGGIPGTKAPALVFFGPYGPAKTHVFLKGCSRLATNRSDII